MSSRPGWGWDAALPPQAPAAVLASPSSPLALGGLVRGWRPLAYGGCLLGVQSEAADPVHGRSSDCVPPRGSPLQAKPKGLPGTRDGDSQPRPSQGGGGLPGRGDRELQRTAISPTTQRHPLSHRCVGDWPRAPRQGLCTNPPPPAQRAGGGSESVLGEQGPSWWAAAVERIGETKGGLQMKLCVERRGCHTAKNPQYLSVASSGLWRPLPLAEP